MRLYSGIPATVLKTVKGQGMASNRPPSPLIDKPLVHAKRRSLSPKSILLRRPPSPLIDPQTEVDMNRVRKNVHKALKARLYLLHQPGPHSFLIGGDSPEHKYRVIIGPQTCSCSKEPFCLHILFVMLRVFKVKENDPLLWSRELKNYEVESLFRQYQKRIELQSRQKLCAMKVKEKLRSLEMTASSTSGSSGASGPFSSRDDDDVCPICLLDMVEGESLTTCKESCHNRLHHHCMAIWGQECKRRREPVICPLCRAEWGPSVISSLLKPSMSDQRTSASSGLTLESSSSNNSTGSQSLQILPDDAGLPAGDVVPDTYKEVAEPWIVVFGAEMVNCLFSRDWKHREAGLRCMSRRVVKILTERRTTSSYRQTKWEVLEVCASILKHVTLDPVYTVYVSALRALRAILSHVTCHSEDDMKRFCTTFRNTVENIVLKCADSNRRVSVVSLKILQEFVKGTDVSSPCWSAIAIDFVLDLLKTEYSLRNTPAMSWQWLLGCVVLLKKFLEENLNSILGFESVASNLPTPDSDFDMSVFLMSLEAENNTNNWSRLGNENSSTGLCHGAVQRLLKILLFCEQAILSRHKKVYTLCLGVLVKTASILAHDRDAFTKGKSILVRLNPSVKTVLQRQLSSEHITRQHAVVSEAEEDSGVESYMVAIPAPVGSPRLGTREQRQDEESLIISKSGSNRSNDDAMDICLESVSEYTSSGVLTPPPSPNATVCSDDFDMDSSVQYQERVNQNPVKCEQLVAEEEALALAKAMNVSLMASEVVPKQLVPVNEEVIIHVQSEVGGQENEGPHSYLESIHWKKGSLLGTGAYSSCFEALDVKTGRLMAVKQVSFCRNSEPEQDKVQCVVLEEISLLHRLRHNNVVRFLGATQHVSHYNIFMEYMSGGSISRILNRFGPFDNNVITKYTLQILSGVSYLHQNKTLHRDIKGANILVDSSGQVVKLSDFGTAARLLSQGTGSHEFSGQLLGTIAFMAPEVLRGQRYGRKCDIWSVGCVIIEMATAKPPWDADEVTNHLALMYRIASSTCPPPVPSSLAPGLRDVALRCLENDEEDRASAKELLGHSVFTS